MLAVWPSLTRTVMVMSELIFVGRLLDKGEQKRWQQTLETRESAAQEKVVDATEVHDWLRSWGAEDEQDAPIRIR